MRAVLWVLGLARAPATRLLLRWREPPVPRARPPEVPGELLERRDWTQAGVMWVSWRARGLHWHLTPAIPPKDRLYLLRAESNPGRHRKPANVPRRRGFSNIGQARAVNLLRRGKKACFHPQIGTSERCRSPRSLSSLSSPASRGPSSRRAAENSRLLLTGQLSKLSARPAAPPRRLARGFTTNIQTHTSMRDAPAPPERPNQT